MGPASPRDAPEPEPETHDAGKADGDAEQPEPACAAWRAAIPAIIEAVGGLAKYRTWVVQLTPLSDDGNTLVMGAPASAFWIDYLQRECLTGIEAAVGRRIELKPWSPCDAAAAERVKAGGWCGELTVGAGPPQPEKERRQSVRDDALVTGSDFNATLRPAPCNE